MARESEQKSHSPLLEAAVVMMQHVANNNILKNTLINLQTRMSSNTQILVD